MEDGGGEIRMEDTIMIQILPTKAVLINENT